MKRYDSRQWTMSAAGAALFVLVSVVAYPPWWTIGSDVIHGTARPFFGGWIIALSAAGGWSMNMTVEPSARCRRS